MTLVPREYALWHVEQGPHDALLERGGLYADLWARQSGGFLPDQAADAAA